uniref:Uncharacterized protein n=1 Tax=Romanomermis culicivorax TaxID=13658 RepID=A0A915J192_ROMCU
MKKAQASLPEPPPAYVVETGIGSGKNSLSIRRSAVDDDDNFAFLTLVVCSLVICTLAVVLGMYLYKNRLSRRSNKSDGSFSFFGVGSTDFEGKPSKDYQTGSLRTMPPADERPSAARRTGRPPPDERAAESLASAAGGAGIVGTLAQRLGSQSEPSPPAVQSTHSSTSSW